MSFRIGAVATPHEFYIGAKRHLLKARATNGSVGGSERTSKASVRAEGAKRTASDIEAQAEVP